MVLVEEMNDQNNTNTNNSQSQPSSSSESSGPSSRTSLQAFIVGDKISFLLWLTRLATIVTSIFFVIPISGFDQNSLYQKALMSSAATSALKLHQRLAGQGFQFSRAFFQNLVVEDSFHYLLYSIIFLSSYPITIVLAPVVLFALLHVSSYTRTLINIYGPSSLQPLRKIVNFVIAKDKDMMRFAAINEILLMPCIVIMIFSGRAGIFIPFVYYRFLCLRYQSRRNPYNKQAFTEMRVITEYYSQHPKCPQIVRNIAFKAIALISRIAPPQ